MAYVHQGRRGWFSRQDALRTVRVFSVLGVQATFPPDIVTPSCYIRITEGVNFVYNPPSHKIREDSLFMYVMISCPLLYFEYEGS